MARNDTESLEWVLTNAGFRHCDIAACNCNSWHQVGGYKARFDEIKEVVEEAGYSTNGRTLLDAVKSMAADVALKSLNDAPIRDNAAEAIIDAMVLGEGRYRAVIEPKEDW